MDTTPSFSSYIQANRILRIETPLGADVLLLERMDMREGINDLFTLTATMRSKQTIKPEELIGKLIDISVELGEGQRRTWNGLVTQLVEGPAVTRGLRSYDLVMRPQHWLMSQRSDCRIWMDKTSLDVAQILLSEHKLIAPVTTGVIPEPKPQHYSVQYNETDLAYLLRRLEEDGLYYFFKHSGGTIGSVAAQHVMHIASHVSGYLSGAEPDVRFALGSTDRNHINALERRFSYVPGKQSGREWSFLTPNTVPAGTTPSLVSLPGNEAYELFEYPMVGGYGTDGASEDFTGDRVEQQAKLRMQAMEAEHERSEGTSTVRTLAPGERFKPYDVANPGNTFDEMVIFQITHTARDHSYETNDAEPEYYNRFIAMPSRVPATPQHITPRPRIDGTDIALIAGPAGEEIHPDKYGRVKVWFPWDRKAKKDGSDTCWIRVAQNWAGTSWGGQVIPRVGQEAIVAYLGGDPDRPIITALVPNTKQKVPYGLPANKTKMVIRSNTYKGSGYNELHMEDQTGAQNFFMHAEKDQTVKVKNNQTHRVDQSHIHSVGQHHSVQVGGNHSHQVGGGMNQVIGLPPESNPDVDMASASSLATSGGAGMASGAASLASAVAGAVGSGVLNQIISRIHNVVIGIAKTEQIGETAQETVGIDKAIEVGSTFGTVVGVAKTEKIGKTALEMVGVEKTIDVGNTFNIVVGEKLTITVGRSQLVMDKDGNVTITGQTHSFRSEGPTQIKGEVIEMN